MSTSAGTGTREVMVIGAGIIGVSLADALVRRGSTVTLVDPGEPGSGTTGVSYAWINSHKKHPLPYHQLNEQGVRAWRGVAVSDPDAVAFTGHIEFAEDEAHQSTLTQRVERLSSLGYPARWIDATEAQGCTGIPVPQGALTASFDGEGHAFPARRLRTLLNRLESSGRFTMIADRALRLTEDSRGVVVTTAGGELRAAFAVVAAGNGSAALVDSAGGRLPLVPAVMDGPAYGYLARAEVPGHPVRGLLTTDRLSLRPDGDDRLLLQALDLDADADPAVTPQASVAAAFGERVSTLFPDREVRVLDVRVGHRVIPADGLTAAGRIAPGSAVFTVVTHSGVVLSPWLAEVIAEEICGAEPDPLLAGFQPSRFLEDMAGHAVPAPRSPGDQ